MNALESRRARWVHRAVLVALSALFLAPLAWMVILSLQGENAGLAAGPFEFPQGVHPENYPRAIEQMDGFWRLFWNTTALTVLCILGQLFCCSLAGYAFARLRFAGRDALFLLVLATMMLPPQVLAIPQFLLYRELGLIDTYYPLVLPTVLGGAPFFIFLFRQYFLTIPGELMEAARVDGAGPFRTFFLVMLPMAKPVIGAVAIFTFPATWNDFWTPLIYILSPEKQTLTLGLAAFNQSYRVAVEFLMAASSLVLAPCVIVYFVFQKVFVRGVRMSGKG